MSSTSKSDFRQRSISFLQIALGLVLAFSSTVGHAYSQDVPSVGQIERFLSSQTAVVGWVDLSKVEIDALAAFAEKLGFPKEDTTEVKAIQAALVQLSVKRVYWVSDLGSLMSGTNGLIIPCDPENSNSVLLILKALGGEGKTATVVDGSIVLFGDKENVEQFQKASGQKIDPLLLKAVSNISHSHGLAIRTPIAALIPIVSVLPNVFKDSAQVAQATELLVKIQSVMISTQLPPGSSEIRVSTESAEAAKGLAELLNTVMAKRIGESAAGLTVTAQGNDALLKIASREEADAAAASFVMLTAPARAHAARASTMNSLKQVGLAMHNFHATYGAFPAQALADKDGNKLLSWRVLILPYLDQQALYEQFHLDEPWDSEHNKTLISQMPFAYGAPNQQGAQAGKTRIVVPLTKDSVFGHKGGTGLGIRDILDGTSNTLMVVESSPEKAVIWTKPEDITIDAAAPLASIINDTAEGFHACLCDGAARFFPRSLAEKTLIALITFAGKEAIDYSKL